LEQELLRNVWLKLCNKATEQLGRTTMAKAKNRNKKLKTKVKKSKRAEAARKTKAVKSKAKAKSKKPAKKSASSKARTYKILLMGASYGSLLASKLLFGGHSIHLVCLPAEADLINAEGF